MKSIRHYISLIENAENNVWICCSKEDALRLINHGPSDGNRFHNHPLENKNDDVVLEFSKSGDKYNFAKVYSGVIDDPLEETDTSELDEIAIGGLKRCTAVTINALCKAFHLPGILLSDVPVDNPGVLRILDAKGLAYRPYPMESGRTIQQFGNMHKFDAWYLLTPGHAMALIRGELFDAENRGLDGRRIQAAFKISRR